MSCGRVHCQFIVSYNVPRFLKRTTLGINDVCDLEEVNQGALLHTLKVRFAKDKIYTRVAYMPQSLISITFVDHSENPSVC